MTSAKAAAKKGCKASNSGTHQCNFTQRRKSKFTTQRTRGPALVQNFRAGGDFNNGRDSEGGNGGGRR